MDDKKRVILLVEDNLIAANVVKIIFESLGCVIEHVTDGQDAIDHVFETAYDAICMDIGLPNMSGIEACKAIRGFEKERKLPPIPIIALTGNNSPEEINEYIQSGMQAVIDKPFSKEKAVYFLSFCK